MDNNKEQPLSRLSICGGCGSSGTTLLAHLISRHPQIASGPEFNCFNHPELYDISELQSALPLLLAGRARPHGYIDVPVFMTFRDHYGITDDLIYTWVEHSDDSAGFVNLLMDHLLSQFGSKLFFEKSPTNAYCLSMASRSLPGVRLVHMIRDGRDVATSMMKRGWNLFGAGSRWLYDTVRGLDARDAPNYLEVRYENLVTSSEKTLDSLLMHLGVNGSGRGLLQSTAKARGLYTEDWMNRSEPKAWSQTPADPISDKSLGKYKTGMSRRDLDILYRIRLAPSVNCSQNVPRSFGELLEYLGYSTTVDIPTVPPNLINRASYQVRDYLRRVRRFQGRGCWYLPRHYTRLE